MTFLESNGEKEEQIKAKTKSGDNKFGEKIDLCIDQWDISRFYAVLLQN